MNTALCSKCSEVRLLANLILMPSGERWCPEHVGARLTGQASHPTMAPAPAPLARVVPTVAETSGLGVEDVPRSRLGRRRIA